jgi:hypothetical protein
MLMPTLHALPEQPQATLYDQNEAAYIDMTVNHEEATGVSVSTSSRLFELSEAVLHLDKFAIAENDFHRVKNATDEGLADGLKGRYLHEHELAYAHFAKAWGAYGLIEHGYNSNAIHRQAWTDFVNFKKQLLTNAKSPEVQARKLEDRRQYRQTLLGRIVAGDASPVTTDSTSDAIEGAGDTDTNLHTSYPKYLGERGEKEETLNTREKLIGLRDDQRARFIPATHREKNSAIELLDYLDRPAIIDRTGKRRNGIEVRLNEIYARQANLPFHEDDTARKAAEEEGLDYVGKPKIALLAEGRRVADDTIRAIVQEWGDYLMDARYSTTELSRLSEVLSGYDNPNITLAEALNDFNSHALDPKPLLRYLDLSAFREKGELPDPLFDPLRTREVNPVGFPDKKKIIASVYLNPADEEHLGAYFESKLRGLTVGDARRVCALAAKDSLQRSWFFSKVLRKISEDSDFYDYAQSALKAA